MLARLRGTLVSGPYARTFIPVSDAILRPYEAETADRLTRRTTAPETPPIDYVELRRQAQESRRAYLAQALPRWQHGAGTAVKALLVASGQRLAQASEAFWNWMESFEQSRRERYIAQATDIYDVERRIRALERSAVRGWY